MNKFRAKKLVSCLLAGCLILLFGSVAWARVLEDFEDISDWGIYGDGFDTARTKIEAVTYDGKKAMEITNVLPPRDSGLRYAGPNLHRRNNIGPALSFSFYGNNNGKMLIVRCTDQSGESFQWQGPNINWSGWQTVSLNLTAGSSWGHWGGNNNGEIDGGLTFNGIHIDYYSGPEINETLYLAELEVADELPEELSVTFTDGQYNTTTGLYQIEVASDGRTDFASDVGGKSARRTNPSVGRYQMYFDIDDTYVASIPADTGIEVEVEYYDNNYSIWGPFLLYNAAGNDYKSSPRYEMTGTNEWRRAKFILTDYKFTAGSDFMLVGDTRGNSGFPLSVHKVTVRKVQLGSLAGRVTSGGSGLVGAQVRVLHPNYPGMTLEATSDNDGYYQLKAPAGACVVYAVKDGYGREKRENFTISGTVNLNFTLQSGYGDGVSVDFGRYNDADGLYLSHINEGNAFLTEVQAAGALESRDARRTNRASHNYFVFLNVSDQYIYSQLTSVDLTVTYLDQGTGSWRVDYNSDKNFYQFGPEVQKTNTGEWKTKTFRLHDAFFANKTNGVDIRLNAKWEGGEDDDVFATVKIQKAPTAQVTGSVRNADPQVQVALPGAQIILQSTTYGNVKYTSTTDTAGEFALQVAVDEYDVIISKPGVGFYRETIQVTEAGALIAALIEEGQLGFEKDYPMIWEFSQGSNFSFDTQEKMEGEGSLKITGGAAAEQYKGTVRLPVTAANSYRFELWIKTQDVSAADGVRVNILQVKAGDKDNGAYLKWDLLTTGGSHDWQRFEVALERSQMKADTIEVRLYVRLAAGVTGTVWFDKVSLTPELSVKRAATDVSGFSPVLGQEVTFSYEVSACAATTLELSRADWQLTLFQDVPLLGGGAYIWDGKQDGQPLADGVYTYRLTAARGGDTVFAEGQITVDNTGPGRPQITAPEPEAPLEHNQPAVLLQGRVDEMATVIVYREVSGETVELASQDTDPLGFFSLEAGLLEGDNRLWIVAKDALGNESEPSADVLINYNAQRSIGIVTVENGDLLSPRNADGVRDELKIAFHLLVPGAVSFAVTGPSGQVWQDEREITQEEDVEFRWAGVDAQQKLVADGVYHYTLQYRSETEEKTLVAADVQVDNTPPLKPIMLFPKADGAVTGQPRLSWEKIGDAAYYLLYLGTDADSFQEPIRSSGCEYQTEELAQGLWHWKLLAVDLAGNQSEAAAGSFSVTSLDQSAFDVVGFQAGPNPFTPNSDGRREKLVVSYTLRQPGKVRVSIVNLAGKPVRQLDFGELGAGDHQFSWDGCDGSGSLVATGVYLLRLVATNPVSWGPAVKVQPLFVLR